MDFESITQGECRLRGKPEADLLLVSQSFDSFLVKQLLGSLYTLYMTCPPEARSHHGRMTPLEDSGPAPSGPV